RTCSCPPLAITQCLEDLQIVRGCQEAEAVTDAVTIHGAEEGTFLWRVVRAREDLAMTLFLVVGGHGVPHDKVTVAPRLRGRGRLKASCTCVGNRPGLHESPGGQ